MTTDGTDKPLWRRLHKQLVRALLPNHCYLCGDMSDAFLCPGCQQDLPCPRNACYCCALPLADETPNLVCGDCLQRPKPFTRTLAGLQYAHPVDFLVNRFKHQRHFACGSFLADTLLPSVKATYETGPWPELLVPVPLHWSRHWTRGFNQSHQIAHRLSRYLDIPVAHACQRHQRNPRQQGLNRRERLHNLRKAFAVVENVADRHLALIDDVMTTGATVTELAACLRKAGAARVDVWVLARVP